MEQFNEITPTSQKLNGKGVDPETPTPESLNEKYFRLIEKANQDLSLGEFIFIHDDSHFRVTWYNGKWSDPVPMKLLS